MVLLLESYVVAVSFTIVGVFFTNVLCLRLLEQYVFVARDLGCCCLVH